MRLLSFLLTISLLCAEPGFAQVEGERALAAFLAWRNIPEHKQLTWEAATAKYEAKLVREGLTLEQARKTVSILAAHDEGTYYDPVYANTTPTFPTAPNKLLMEAVAGRRPGKALDVGMGQGRNSLFLARRGWDVTGFDTSKVGLEQARQAAAASNVSIRALYASDEAERVPRPAGVEARWHRGCGVQPQGRGECSLRVRHQ